MEKPERILLESYLVSSCEKNMGLVEYLTQNSSCFPSKKGLIKALKRGEITVNGQNAGKNCQIQAGDTIQHYTSQQTPPKEYPRELEILFEDDYVAIIRKPAGILVSGNTYHCIENALGYNLQASKSLDALPWPKPVHRLDRDTTGVLLVAKSSRASVALGRQFQNRSVKKKL